MQFDYQKQPGLCKNKTNITEHIAPLVSIITPYYNAGRYFEQTYNCVVNQTFPYFEWIIVNDGSTENLTKLKELANADARITIINQENSGQAKSRNRAIAASTSDIIVPLDADDLIIPTYIELVYWGLKQNPGAGWCYTDSVGFQEEEYTWVKSFSSERLKYNNFLVCTAAIRKADLLEAGGYDESSKHYDEDWKLWLDLLAAGKYPVHLNVIGFWYRRTSSGMGSQVRADKHLKSQSDAIAKQAADKIKEPIHAIEYPLAGITNRFLIPTCSSWEGSSFDNQKKINVLMVLPWLEMGGADLFNLEVVRGLDKNLFGISIITTVKSSNTWIQKFQEYTNDIFPLPDFLDMTDYPEFISYVIKSRKINILFLSNSYYGYYLLPWLTSHFPDVTIVDYVHMEEWYWRRGGYSRISGVFGSLIQKTFVCNEKSRGILIEEFGRDKTSVETLYIGVDSGKYSPQEQAYGSVYDMFGIEKDTPIVLFPCRLHPQKRPFLMIEIARELKRKKVNIAFVVVGDGPQMTALKETVTEYGLDHTIYFAGRQDRMLPFYRDAVATLICSLKEGLALTAYESLSMETPVITADVGGQAELIDSTVGAVIPLLQEEADSLDKRTFSLEEINLYVNAIINIIQDPEGYSVMCRKCRERIIAQFSTKKMLSRLQEEFTNLVSASQEKKATPSQDYETLMTEFCTLYTEYELLEDYAKNVNHPLDTKNELIRIANSKWGNRLIKLAFKLKLNKLFH